MQRTKRLVAAITACLCLIGLDGGSVGAAPSATSATSAVSDAVADAVGAVPEAGRATRVRVNSPWGKDDTVGEAFRPQGDLRRIIITNGHQRVNFFWRMVAQPLWDTPATDRITGIDFAIDWHGTSPAIDREVIFTRIDNVWKAAILGRRGQVLCTRQAGGVRVQPGFRFSTNAPIDCLGGPRVLRVATAFVDDQDDTAVVDTKVDFTPNSRFYGPFIRLPQRGRASEAVGADGWTRH